MSEKFRLDRKVGFQNTFYTKCINVIIDSIGPSIILRSIYIDVPRALTNDLWVFLFQTIDAEYVKNEPVRLEHMCMSKLL